MRCPNCRHELFVSFSCRGRCFCPSCHEKRALEKASWVAEHGCAEVPHRQFVFTNPKRLRLYLRYDRSLLGALCQAAWRTVCTVYQATTGRPDAVPGMVEAIETLVDLIRSIRFLGTERGVQQRVDPMEAKQLCDLPASRKLSRSRSSPMNSSLVPFCPAWCARTLSAVACALPLLAPAAGPRQQAFFKASNPGAGDAFGWSIAVSGDTMIVGAPNEDSAATGINGDQSNDSVIESGAAYIFVRHGSNWVQQAYLKASNPDVADNFGWSVAISGDTAVVGAFQEDSAATGVNGDQSDNSGFLNGAAYVFVRNGTNWTQQAYLKASNPDFSDNFGISVAVSGDTIVVGAHYESSSATGVNGDQTDNTARYAGAAYVFQRSGTQWTQQAYLKASNTEAGDFFGWSVAVSGDTIVVGALAEDSSGTGVNPALNDNNGTNSGAAYVFVRSGVTWTQQAVIKASNTGINDAFGFVALDGDTLVIGAPGEDSASTSINGREDLDTAPSSGAAYVFTRTGTVWTQQAYLKASNAEVRDNFGISVAVSGSTVVIGAHKQGSTAIDSGAAYAFIGLGVLSDADGDGVPDSDDQCADTPRGAVADATGCSIEQLAPCDGPWRNHGQFLQALRAVTSRFVQQGLITEQQRRAILNDGASSDCGKK